MRPVVELASDEWSAVLAALEALLLEGAFKDERAARRACESMTSQLASSPDFRAYQDKRPAESAVPSLPKALCPSCDRKVPVGAIRGGSGHLRVHRSQADTVELCPGSLHKVHVNADDVRARAAGDAR